MTFKCTCDESRTDEIRGRLQRAPLSYIFYRKLLNRPVFEFESETEMMRAVMAVDGQLMVMSAPPRGEQKLNLGQGVSGPRNGIPVPPAKPVGTGPRRSGVTLRPPSLDKIPPARPKRAKSA